MKHCIISVTVLLLAACQPEEGASTTRDTDALLERMNVRVIGSASGEEQELQIDPDDFRSAVRRECDEQLLSGPLAGMCGASTPTSECNRLLCEAEAELCVAHELMNYARTVAPVALSLSISVGSTSIDHRLPPQSPATNAGLAERAMVAAQSASLLAASALFQHRGPACDLPATIPVADDETQRGTVYAATLMVV